MRSSTSQLSFHAENSLDPLLQPRVACHHRTLSVSESVSARLCRLPHLIGIAALPQRIMEMAHHVIARLRNVADPHHRRREDMAVDLHPEITTVMTVTIVVDAVEREAGLGAGVEAEVPTVVGAEGAEATHAVEVHHREDIGGEIVRHRHLHHVGGEAQATARIVATAAVGVVRGAGAGTGMAGEDEADCLWRKKIGRTLRDSCKRSWGLFNIHVIVMCDAAPTRSIELLLLKNIKKIKLPQSRSVTQRLTSMSRKLTCRVIIFPSPCGTV